MADEVGASSVAIFPTFQGFRSNVVRETEAAASDASSSFGSRFTSGIGRTLKGVGVVVGATLAAGAATVTAGIGAVLSKGLDRSLNLQEARAQLDGLGHSTESVDAIMTNALASVKGTAFGLDTAATLAASVVAAGVKPGQELERTLRLTADAATIAKTPLNEMGSIVNKVASSGKLTTEVLNQFADRGVPLLQFVADEYGVTADKAQEMVTRGEVDFAAFQNALENNVAGAALTSGNTARGAFANIGAAFGRLGARFTGGAVDAAPGLFQSIAAAVDRADEALAPYADRFNTALLPALDRVRTWVDGIDFGAVITGVENFISGLSQIGSSGSLSSIGDSLTVLKPALAEFAAAMPTIGGAVATLIAGGITVLAGVLGFLADNVDTIIAIMPLLVGGFVAMRVATAGAAQASLAVRAAEVAATPIYLANNIMRLQSVTIERQLAVAKGINVGATNAGALATARSTVATVAGNVATAAAGTAARVAAAGQWLLNAALTANPIGIIIALIVALVAGLVWFFTQTELGKTIWAEFTRFLAEAWANIQAGIMTVFTAIGGFLSGFWGGLKALFFGAINFLIGLFLNWTPLGLVIKNFGAIVGFFQTLFSDIGRNVSIGIARVVLFFTRLPGDIMGTLRNAGTMLYSVGKDIIGGLVNGVQDMVGKAVQAVKDVGGAMLDGVKGFLGIRSPSRRFRREVGQQAGEGVRLGLLDKVDEVKRTAARLVTMPDVQPVSTSMSSAVRAAGVAGELGEGPINIYGNVGWMPAELRRETTQERRKKAAVANLGAVRFA